MSTVHPNSESGNTFYMITKGAVDVLLTEQTELLRKTVFVRLQKKIRKQLKNRTRYFQDQDFVYLLLHTKKCLKSL